MGHGVLIRVGQVGWPVLRQNRHEEFGLHQVFARLETVRAFPAAVGNDQLVDREAFRARQLNEDAVAIDDGGVNRICQEIVQEVKRLSIDAKSGKFAKSLFFLE